MHGIGSWCWSGYQIYTATHALLHLKLRSVVLRQARPRLKLKYPEPPAPFPFHTSNDWSVNHYPQKKEGVHGSHLLIPVVQDVVRNRQTHIYYFYNKLTFPFILGVPQPKHSSRYQTSGVCLAPN
jgi:hypothetical protein